MNILKSETPFSIQIEGENNSKKTVHIFMDGKEIGSYIREYPAFAEETFHPFKLKGKWFALYSGDYTTTRIMSLPDCKDIGGEENDTFGFCPVDFHVPAFRKSTSNYIIKDRDTRNDKTVVREKCHFENSNSLKRLLDEMELPHNPKRKSSHSLNDWEYTPFGFVAGCIWGDDSSWKVQYLDLSEADKGIIKRDDRFEYWELPPNISLEDAITLQSENGINFGIYIARMQYFSGLTHNEEKFTKQNENNFLGG